MNRLDLYEKIQGNVLVPPFTTDVSTVKVWLEEGRTVVLKYAAKDGKVFLLKCADDLLKFGKKCLYVYTQYVPKKEEFVVHVKNKSVSTVYETKLVRKAPYPIRGKYTGYANERVPRRSHKNIPTDVFISANKVAEILGEDVEVTVLWNPFRKKAYVLGATNIGRLEEGQEKTVPTSLSDLFETELFTDKAQEQEPASSYTWKDAEEADF